MPRYYFNVFDDHLHSDIRGMTLDDPSAAQLEAIQFAGDMLVQAPENFLSVRQWLLKVFDEADELIFEIDVRPKLYK